MAACPTVTDFRVRFPEYSDIATYTDLTIQYWLDDACLHLSEDSWGECWRTASVYYAAHQLTLSLQRQAQAASGSISTSAAGAVTSSSADGLSISFGSPSTAGSNAESIYLSTPYGQQFLVLADECILNIGVAGSSGLDCYGVCSG
jgi:hypothetical protein